MARPPGLCVTIGLANDRTEEWVRWRTGHKSSALDRYRRVAKTIGEMNVGDWTPLDLAIRSCCRDSGSKRGSSCGETD